jgi:hypothetical protein
LFPPNLAPFFSFEKNREVFIFQVQIWLILLFLAEFFPKFSKKNKSDAFLAVTFFRNWPCRVQFTFGLDFFFFSLTNLDRKKCTLISLCY